MKIRNWGHRRFHTGLIVLTLCITAILTGCGGGTSDTAKITDAYIDGFSKFYEQGNEYTDLGLQLQADYAYGWAAASVSAMRCCADNLISQKSEGRSLEEISDGRMTDWNEIASMSYASPYPWYFEGLIFNAQGKNDEAQACYEKALLNPAFSAEHDETLSVMLMMSVEELEATREKLAALEDKIFAVYKPEQTVYPREALGFDDVYLCTLAKECLASDTTDYRGALRHYKAALKVNPYEGDNFVGCALMHLYLEEMDEVFFYVNEGLFVDPEHEGLNKMADILNGGVS
ncbi:MAG TPA: hypothetical protein DD738_11020 [Ruminiclostridium sp.]|nr:hypothetical protein [Ruminiclostridium sp.]